MLNYLVGCIVKGMFLVFLKDAGKSLRWILFWSNTSQVAFTCSKSTIVTQEKGVKYVQS